MTPQAHVELLSLTVPTTNVGNHLIPRSGGTEPADHLAELAGRSCYLSFHRPNSKTAENEDYLGNILEMQHYSILEHGSATFYITGVSRNFTHELVRHRHLSFSQLSQRFVNESNSGVIQPPAFQQSRSNLEDLLEDHWRSSRALYDGAVARLRDEGYTRKQAREASRAFLPSSIETRIIVTGNHRAWREFLTKRMSPHADAEMQEVAHLIYDQLIDIAPNTYQDFTKEDDNRQQ